MTQSLVTILKSSLKLGLYRILNLGLNFLCFRLLCGININALCCGYIYNHPKHFLAPSKLQNTYGAVQLLFFSLLSAIAFKSEKERLLTLSRLLYGEQNKKEAMNL